jgi:hypothetical protein
MLPSGYQPRPNHRRPTPPTGGSGVRPARQHGDEYWTCHVCKAISNYTKWLDGEAICHRCLHEKRFGELERVCEARGYHETAAYSTGSSRNRIDVHCACNRSVEFDTDDINAEPPRRWAADGYKLAPLPEESH